MLDDRNPNPCPWWVCCGCAKWDSYHTSGLGPLWWHRSNIIAVAAARDSLPLLKHQTAGDIPDIIASETYPKKISRRQALVLIELRARPPHPIHSFIQPQAMALFSPSKRDKHSRSPTPSERRNHEETTPLQRRGSRQSSVLPVTTQDSIPRRRPRGGTANNFLAGGMYVERKRTKRRHYPRRSLFRRRRLFVPAVSGIFFLMLVYYHFHSTHTSVPNITDPAIHLPPTEYTKVLLRERKRLREEHWNDRLDILQRLAPKWFYRNQKALELSKPPNDIQDEAAAATTTISDPHALRTLANMDNVPSSSSCPGQLVDTAVTLVVQTSTERLWILHETCKRWTHPIVAVVAVQSDDNNSDLDEQIMASVQEACSTQLDLVTHAIDLKTAPYPVNVLRNLGLDRVRTSHVIMADIDFVPSEHLDELIVQYVEDRGDHDAMIVPAFQRVLDPPCTTVDDCKQHLASNESFLPRTFDELAQCHETEDCIVFQSDNNWEGHSSTGSNQWLQRHRTENESPRQLRCFDSMRYEPYVVLRWCPSNSTKPVAPYYDERFHGYGKNKIQLIAHIRFLGYKFFVLPEGFIVHNPHLPSTSKREWENSKQSNLHEQMDRLYESFLRDLLQKYYETHRNEIVEQCSRHDKA